MIQNLNPIVQYIANNTTLVNGTTLQLGYFEADAPDRCVAVILTGGRPEFDLPDFIALRVQVLTRALDYATALEDAQTVFALLHGAAGITLPVVDSGEAYLLDTAEAVDYPYSLAPDEAGRFQITTNYILRIQDA